MGKVFLYKKIYQAKPQKNQKSNQTKVLKENTVIKILPQYQLHYWLLYLR
jgi:hypothetical protein